MGKVLINGIPYGGSGGGANYTELTQQEYDALTTEEKLNGELYFITDGQSEEGDNYFFPLLYSEEEREVGTWIDGKPIYAKSYTMSGTANEQRLAINTDIETIVKTEGYVTYDNNQTYLGLNEFVADSLYTMTHIGGIGTNNPEIYNFSQFKNVDHEIFITLYYTKTTDTPGSGKYNTLGVPSVHYSTDEQIVGTWIDGRTVYEKTWINTIPAWDSSKNGCVIGTGFTDYDEILDIRGSMKGTVKAYGSLNGLEESGWRGNVHVTTAGEVMLYANNSGDVASLVGGKAIITIRYTKTQGGA